MYMTVYQCTIRWKTKDIFKVMSCVIINIKPQQCSSAIQLLYCHCLYVLLYQELANTSNEDVKTTQQTITQ